MLAIQIRSYGQKDAELGPCLNQFSTGYILSVYRDVPPEPQNWVLVRTVQNLVHCWLYNHRYVTPAVLAQFETLSIFHIP